MSTAIQKLREFHFAKGPTMLPIDIACGVESTEAAVAAVAGHKLRQLSAPEILFAYIEAIHNDLARGDDDVINNWRKTALCIPVLFKVMVSDDTFRKGRRQAKTANPLM